MPFPVQPFEISDRIGHCCAQCAMLKSKSFTLEKPKHSEGWIKIQEWDRRWNKILSIVFGVLTFMLLFAIVLANTMSTAAVLPSAPNITTTPVLESTTSELFSTMETSELSTSSELESTTTEETTSNEVTDGRIIQPTDYYHFHDDDSLQILDFCFMISCNITCTNGRLNDITRIIDTLYRRSRCWAVHLELNRCSFSRRRVTRNWLTTKAVVLVLQIVNSNVRGIEDKSFSSPCFKKLHTLVLRNTEMQCITSKKTFVGLENLQRLELINLPLKMFSSEVFVPFAAKLLVLVFEEMLTPVFPVSNITGKFSGLSNVSYLSLKYNRLGPLNEDSFAGLENIVEMDLRDSGIAEIERRTFDHSKSLKHLFLNGNNIESIPFRIFDVILKNEKALIDLSGNPFICDCRLKQLQSYLDDPKTRRNFVLPLTCILPTECWEEFVADCNVCLEKGKPTTTTDGTTEISPLSPSENITTMPLPTSTKRPPEKPDDDVVTCFNKAAFVTLMVMSLLLSATVGAVGLFCAIRHCPSLIKRAKSTFVPKKPPPEVPAFPSGASATPRSSTSKPPFLRSLSDTSIASGRSYVSAINPPHLRNISWNMSKANYIHDNSMYLEDNFFDRPPPLPPHPRRNSSLTTDAPSTRTTCTYSTNENIYELYE